MQQSISRRADAIAFCQSSDFNAVPINELIKKELTFRQSTTEYIEMKGKRMKKVKNINVPLSMYASKEPETDKFNGIIAHSSLSKENLIEYHTNGYQIARDSLPLNKQQKLDEKQKTHWTNWVVEKARNNGVNVSNNNEMIAYGERMKQNNYFLYHELRPCFAEKNVVCIDVDGLKSKGDVTLEELFSNDALPEELIDCAFTLSRTNSLPHFYFICDDMPQELRNANYQDVFSLHHSDLLSKQAWELVDAQIYNFDVENGLTHIDWNVVKSWFKTDITTSQKSQSQRSPTTAIESTQSNELPEDIEELAEDIRNTVAKIIALNVGYFNSHENWRNLKFVVHTTYNGHDDGVALLYELGKTYKFQSKSGKKTKLALIANEYSGCSSSRPLGERMSIKSLHKWLRDLEPVAETPIVCIVPKQNIEHPVIKSKAISKPVITVDDLNETATRATDSDIAELFVKHFGANYKYTGKKAGGLYLFNNNALWENDVEASSIINVLSADISNAFKKEYANIQNKINEGSANTNNQREALVNQYAMNDVNKLQAEMKKLDKETKKQDELLMKQLSKFDKCINKLESSRNQTDIIKAIYAKDKIKTNGDEFVASLNRDLYTLPLKNKKVINLQTNTVSERTTAHKFSYEMDVSYIELSTEDKAYAEKYFRSLFCNNVETTQCVIDILKSSMVGNPMKHIFFCIGSGSNGKSLLFKLLRKMGGKNFADEISENVIIEQKQTSALTTELTKLEKCRIAITSELEENQKLNVKQVKRITGGDGIDVRELHTSNKTSEPTANLFVATNNMPKIKIEKGDAFDNRLIVIPFNNKFQKTAGFEEELIGKRDILFSYIMQQGNVYDDFKDRLTTEMMFAKSANVKELDVLADYIKQNYVITEDDKDKIVRDEFLKGYFAYVCGENKPFEEITDGMKKQFTERLKKYKIGNKRSNSIPYYIGIRCKTDEEKANETNLEADE